MGYLWAMGDIEEDVGFTPTKSLIYPHRRFFLRKTRGSGIILLLKEYQQPNKDDRAEHKEIAESNDRQPDPHCFFFIGCFMKNVRIAGYVFLIDGITNNYKEKKDDHA